jgi:hypothetical protein
MRFQIVMGHSPCTRRSSWRNRILYRLDLAASSAATAGSSRDGRIKGSGRPPTQEMVGETKDLGPAPDMNYPTLVEPTNAAENYRNAGIFRI